MMPNDIARSIASAIDDAVDTRVDAAVDRNLALKLQPIMDRLELIVAGAAATLAAKSAPQADELLTRKQLAERAKINVRTLRKLELRNETPKRVKIGNRPRYRKVDVDRWLSGGGLVNVTTTRTRNRCAS